MAHGGPPNQIPEITSYSALVARQPKPSKGPRPQQGARLLALRKASGLTQIELAKALDVPQANIAFWEWSDKPPRSDLLSKMAKAFGVKLEDLLLSSERPIAKRKGPIGEVQRTFEAVTKLPRKQQRKVLEMVQALVEQYKRKAS
jgi:transcriptional regulator with XRE-family HTH domain